MKVKPPLMLKQTSQLTAMLSSSDIFWAVIFLACCRHFPGQNIAHTVRCNYKCSPPRAQTNHLPIASCHADAF